MHIHIHIYTHLTYTHIHILYMYIHIYMYTHTIHTHTMHIQTTYTHTTHIHTCINVYIHRIYTERRKVDWRIKLNNLIFQIILIKVIWTSLPACSQPSSSEFTDQSPAPSQWFPNRAVYQTGLKRRLSTESTRLLQDPLSTVQLFVIFKNHPGGPEMGPRARKSRINVSGNTAFVFQT